MTQKTICLWRETDGDHFKTQCGNAFCFIADGLKENGFKFCPFCGNKIKERET